MKTCPGCAREISRAARHEARLRLTDVQEALCPSCLNELIRGFPMLKDKIRQLESEVRRMAEALRRLGV